MTNSRLQCGQGWVINGLPRSGQQQLATRLAWGGLAPAELLLGARDGATDWLIDTPSIECTVAGLQAHNTASADHSVVYMRAPLFATSELSTSVSCHHIHVVRDPRQLFAAYTRRPKLPELLQMARTAIAGKNLTRLQPLWNSDLPGLDLLTTADDDTLRQRFAAAEAWRWYGICYYLWLLALLSKSAPWRAVRRVAHPGHLRQGTRRHLCVLRCLRLESRLPRKPSGPLRGP